MDLVNQVVGLFEQQTPAFINEMEMATREGDVAETRRPRATALRVCE